MPRNDKPFEIIVLGPPVSGKGTQAKLLADTFGIPHISTGQILHAIKTDTSNPLSSEVVEYMDQGQLVPDDLVNKLVLDRIKQDDCRFGFLLDGYPRTLAQADIIAKSSDLDYVFLIDVSDEAVVERISGRRVCRNGHAWHLKYAPSKVDDVCDTCGEALFQRDDDKESVVSGRLDIYHSNMKPILDFFESKGMLIKVDGEQHIEGVFQEMVRHLVYDLRKKILK